MAANVACARSVICTLHRCLSQIPVRYRLDLQQSNFFVSASQHVLSLQPPKKPPGAFLKFKNDKLSDILNKMPGTSMVELNKKAAELWHALDPEEKNKCKMDAKQELQAYREKYMMFLDGLNDTERIQLLQEKVAKKAARRKSRVVRMHKKEHQKFGKPKWPANAFGLFVRSSRLERGNAHPVTFIKSLADYWNQMPQEEKDIYFEDARLEAEKYQREMKEWEERMREMGREDLIRKKSQKKTRKPKMAASSKTVRTKKAQKFKKSATGSSTEHKTKNVKKRTVSKEVQTEE